MLLFGDSARISRGIVAGIVIFLSASLVRAQIGTGQIVGTVTDSSGGVIAEATVTAVHAQTNASRTAKTNSSGLYDLPALPPGTYTLTIEMQGFGSQVRSNIDLQVGQVARFD